MTKQERIKSDMITAMKNRDKKRKDVLSYLSGVLKNAEIDKRHALTDSETDEVINKIIKQTQDVLAMTPEYRQNVREENEFTLSILNEYAPKMMSEAEIRHEVYATCEDLGMVVSELTSKDKGKLMKELMVRVKSKADGKMVNKVVSEYCK